MYCQYCGKEIEDKSIFCSFCGNKIEKNIKSTKSKKYVVGGMNIACLTIIFCFLVIGKNNKEAEVLKTDDVKLTVENVNDAYTESDERFVPDCSKEKYNKVGNTFTNLLNGGQVVSQGNWMYYVRSNGGWGISAWGCQEICKEPIEGGTPVVVYTATDEDIDIEYLNVVGDYIYFKEKTIKRIRCDGKEYKDYGIESKYHFGVFDNQIVYTNEVHESAEYSWWTLMLYDIITGEETNLYESVDPDFWGMEELQDTVIFYMGQPVRSMNQYVVSYYEIKKDLSDGFEDGYVTFNGSGETLELAYRFWHKKMLSGNEVFDIPSNQELCHKEFNKTNQISFSNRYLIMNFNDNYIVGYGTHPGTFKGLMYCTLEEYLNNEYHVINEDEPGIILCAGQWIYYTCNNGVHRVRLDGSGYQVVKSYSN